MPEPIVRQFIGLVEKLADLRGTGSAKRRIWEREVNAYQVELGRVYDKWAKDLAAELDQAETDDEYDDAVDAALLVLAVELKDLGLVNITQGAMLALGSTPPTSAYLIQLSRRLDDHEAAVDRGLVPTLRDRLLGARFDPEIVATGALAYLGVLSALGARVESYAGEMWTAMQEAQGVTAEASGGRVAWQREDKAKHCDDCEQFGEDEFPGRVYDSWDDMMSQTGGRLPGEVQCSANCRCSLWVETEPDEWTREGFSAS